MKNMTGRVAMLTLITLLFAGASFAQVSWWEPENPEPGDLLTIYYDTDPGVLPSGNIKLHWGINSWTEPPQTMWPPNTQVADPGMSVQSPLSFYEGTVWYVEIQTDDTVEQLDYVFTNGTDWDNNGGSDWHIYFGEAPATTWHRFTLDSRSIDCPYTPAQLGTVYLKGDFNGWGDGMPMNGPDERGVYYFDVQLMEIQYGYKYHADGDNWMQDPDNPRTDGGMFNNSLVEATPKDQPYGFGFRPYVGETFQQGETIPLAAQFYPTDTSTGADLTGITVELLPSGTPAYTFDTDTGELTGTIDGLSTGIYTIEIEVTDSEGNAQDFYWGFIVDGDDDGFHAFDSDPMVSDADGPGSYTAPTTIAAVDLVSLTILEEDDGETMAFALDQVLIGDESRVMIQISSTDGTSPETNPDFATEMSLRDFNGVGVQMVLADPSSPGYDSANHNRLITGRDPVEYGNSFDVTVDASGDVDRWQFELPVADLEAVMGSYGSDWYFSVYSFFEGFDPTVDHSWEIGLDNGGIAEDYDPDAFDMMFVDEYSLQHTLFNNHTLGRNVTLDAEGRGIAAISPDEIGPNIGSSGPVLRWLTRDWSTIQGSKTLYAEIENDDVELMIHHSWTDGETDYDLGTVSAGEITHDVTLQEGSNFFQLVGTLNNETSVSSELEIFYNTPQAPVAEMDVSVDGNEITLSAGDSYDPQEQPIIYQWTADPDNPEVVTLSGSGSSVATCAVPATLGEYYFDLTLEDTDGNITHARTMFAVDPDGVDPFDIDKSVDWVQSAIVYEIYVRSYDDSESLDAITMNMWRIANMGYTCIWLMPINPGPSTHGYAITDYKGIEEDYGTLDDFEQLVDTAHSYGIKVVMDQVINHSAIEHPWMQDAIANGEASNTYDWYDRDQNGNYTYYYDWTSLPNLNYDNPDMRHYMIEMAKWWIQEYDVDGYRCDVAWGVQERNPNFWPDWRTALKTIKPECFLLAEAGVNDFTYLTDRFDSAYDWDMHHGSGDSFRDLFGSSFTDPQGIHDRVTNFGFDYPDYTFPFRFLENHDEVRYIVENSAVQTKSAATMLMTIPGIPLIYAGQEVGEESQRGLIGWDDDPYDLEGFYGTLIEMRHRLPALYSTESEFLSNSQSDDVYSYGRWMEGENTVVVALNITGAERATDITIPVDDWGYEAGEDYYLTDVFTNVSTQVTGAELATISHTLPAYTANAWVISDTSFVLDVPERVQLPENYSLGQNYPNPFNPTTQIQFNLGKPGQVQLAVYNVLGQRVATLLNERMTAGAHAVTFDGQDQFGQTLASGVYFYRLEAGDFVRSRKMVLLK
ncbi:T9SS type A sorting domain-containing protein [bacterium]|nr:T9SS type A sorting domain-containing protein [bacterium]